MKWPYLTNRIKKRFALLPVNTVERSVVWLSCYYDRQVRNCYDVWISVSQHDTLLDAVKFDNKVNKQ